MYKKHRAEGPRDSYGPANERIGSGPISLDLIKTK